MKLIKMHLIYIANTATDGFFSFHITDNEHFRFESRIKTVAYLIKQIACNYNALTTVKNM